MTKLGVITDGISREFEHALAVMNEFDLTQAELQFLWDKEAGDLDDAQMDRAQRLVKAHAVEVPCISRHIFGGLPLGSLSVDSPVYVEHLEALKRCIAMAKSLDCPLVRVMSFRKEMILFGSHGAEQWVVSSGAWDKLLKLMAPAVQMAEDADITLAVETGNNAMITSAWLARKLISDLGTDRLKVLWDPANSLYCAEIPFPDGYEALRGGCLAHIHIKDVVVDIPKATVACCPLNMGDMAPYLKKIAQSLQADNYIGSISLESVYRPLDGAFEDGFRASVASLKEIFA